MSTEVKLSDHSVCKWRPGYSDLSIGRRGRHCTDSVMANGMAFPHAVSAEDGEQQYLNDAQKLSPRVLGKSLFWGGLLTSCCLNLFEELCRGSFQARRHAIRNFCETSHKSYLIFRVKGQL